jgi:chromosome segregation ATPase
MTNEQKALRLEEIAAHYIRIGDKDAALLREAAQVMRELGALLTSPDWKTMYEAQERDLAALRVEREGLVGDRDTAISYADSLREQLREAQQQMAADAMLIAEAQRGAEIVADTERRLERRIAELEGYLEDVEAHLRDCRARGAK